MATTTTTCTTTMNSSSKKTSSDGTATTSPVPKSRPSIILPRTQLQRELYQQDVYYVDSDYERNQSKFQSSFVRLRLLLDEYKTSQTTTPLPTPTALCIQRQVQQSRQRQVDDASVGATASSYGTATSTVTATASTSARTEVMANTTTAALRMLKSSSTVAATAAASVASSTASVASVASSTATAARAAARARAKQRKNSMFLSTHNRLWGENHPKPKRKLIGRQLELERLHRIYQTMIQRQRQQQSQPIIVEMVTITGCSGTGKSALVQAFIEELQQTQQSQQSQQQPQPPVDANNTAPLLPTLYLSDNNNNHKTTNVPFSAMALASVVAATTNNDDPPPYSPPLYLSGKFNAQSSHVPFSAMAAALHDFFSEQVLKTWTAPQIMRLQNAIQNAFLLLGTSGRGIDGNSVVGGEEDDDDVSSTAKMILMDLIPSLGPLLEVAEEEKDGTTTTNAVENGANTSAATIAVEVEVQQDTHENRNDVKDANDDDDFDATNAGTIVTTITTTPAASAVEEEEKHEEEDANKSKNHNDDDHCGDTTTTSTTTPTTSDEEQARHQDKDGQDEEAAKEGPPSASPSASSQPNNNDNNVTDQTTTTTTTTTAVEKPAAAKAAVPRQCRRRRDSFTNTAISCINKITHQKAENSYHQLRYFFQALLQAIADHHHSLMILFLDDLQWADSASLGLLEFIMTDQTLENVLFMAAYDSPMMINDEQDEQEGFYYNNHNGNNHKKHPLEQSLEYITQKRSVERIDLSGLSLPVIQDFLAETLGMENKNKNGCDNKKHDDDDDDDLDDDEDDTLSFLAKVIHDKTGGNFFYTIQTLEDLCRRNALHYYYSTDQWEIDTEHVRACMDLTATVVDMIAYKLQSYSHEVQEILVIASFYTPHFTTLELVELVGDILHDEYNDDDDDDEDGKSHHLTTAQQRRCWRNVEQVLSLAVSEGILIQDDDNNNKVTAMYRFAHDRIQQAASSLVSLSSSSSHPDTIRFQIAFYLLKRIATSASSSSSSSPEGGGGDEWMLFMAADHLNDIFLKKDNSEPSCCSDDDDEQTGLIPTEADFLTVANLNLQVGLRAASASAFVPASNYLKWGVTALLRSCGTTSMMTTPWETHYDVALPLYRAAAVCLLTTGGDRSLGEQYAKQVIANAKTLEEKLPVYKALAEALGRAQKHKEAMELSLSVSKMLGVFPQRLFHVSLLQELRAVRKAFLKYSDEEILSMPVLEDDLDNAAMIFLAQAGMRAVYSGCDLVFLFCCLRQISFSFQHGISGSFAAALAGYGLVLRGSFGDKEGSDRMGELAKQLVVVTNAKQQEALVLHVASIYIDAWSLPFPRIIELEQQAHKAGLRSGDLEYAYLARWGAQLYAFASGLPLLSINQTMDKILQQMQGYHVDVVMMRQFSLLLSALIGNAKVPFDLRTSGKINDKNASAMVFRRIWAYLSRLLIAYYFGDFATAERMGRKLRPILSKDYSYVTVSLGLFFSGLAACGLARQTRKWRYKRDARKLLKMVTDLVGQRSGMNNVHRCQLLNAEYMAYCSKNSRSEEKVVRRAYQNAILTAARAGFVQDAALAHELAGVYHASLGRVEDAKYHFTGAWILYQNWGADAKAKDLLRKQTKFIDPTLAEGRKFWVSAEDHKC